MKEYLSKNAKILFILAILAVITASSVAYTGNKISEPNEPLHNLVQILTPFKHSFEPSFSIDLRTQVEKDGTAINYTAIALNSLLHFIIFIALLEAIRKLKPSKKS